jgi:hypothetical protein
MIAPAGEPRDPADCRAGGLAAARRAVAAVLFRQSDEQAPPAPRVASATAWLWAAWVAAIAISYFACAAWWTVEQY